MLFALTSTIAYHTGVGSAIVCMSCISTLV